MSLTLYAHPFAAYCWKVLIALYENGAPFRYRMVDNAEVFAELEGLWPLKKFPVLKDGEHDSKGVAEARTMLDSAYGWLEKQVAQQAWAVGSHFTMGDCAAAPALFYADWVHPIGDRFPSVCAYRARLLARPSIARTVDEARPYRKLFPLGAPDRD